MEQTLSTLAFKGSITEAVAEAKQLKKLFLVYISGDNPESHNLETSTWTDSAVTDSVMKLCTLLHISEESADAANFFAIYTKKPAPCITAVGYNGVQLWQHEGFVPADVLASSIEKAWLSLHIQETTATFLTSALASQKQPPGPPDNSSTEEGSSSRTDVLLPQTNTGNDSTEVRPSTNYEIVEQNNRPVSAVKEKNSVLGDKASPGSPVTHKFKTGVDDDTCNTKTTKSSHSPGVADPNKIPDESHIQKENFDLDDQTETKKNFSQGIANEASEGFKADENPFPEKADVSESSLSKSNDAHLNIRLPDGNSLQVKFSMMDTLRMVKDYIDENQTNSFGSYDLAIPYPRKVFSVQELSQTLLELGLYNRQTLIVVLHHRAKSHPKGESSSHDLTNSNRDGSSDGSNEGYWAYTRRILSYMNPFSYLGGASNSSETVQNSQNNMWQYGPNPSLQNNLRGQGRSSGVYSSNQSATTSTSTSSNSRSRQQSSSHFGSNIHTLKHDEDDRRFADRNTFWNGNSTQFGGDNDGKLE